MVIASELERRWLMPLRATEFRQSLTFDQYIGRNARIFAHPYGKKIRTWLLKEQGEILASMDLLPISLRVKAEHGIEEQNAVLIASVLTPPPKRRRGFAKNLLKTYFATNLEVSAILYSEVGTRFYEAHNFVASPNAAVIRQEMVRSTEEKTTIAVSMSDDEFIHQLNTFRQRTLQDGPYLAAALKIDHEFLEWHLERYRYFAECAGRQLPESLFWSVSSSRENRGSLIAAVPDFLERRMDVLWSSSTETSAMNFVHLLAKDLSLPRVRYVIRSAPPHPNATDIPMIRLCGRGKGTLVDSQLCDYW